MVKKLLQLIILFVFAMPCIANAQVITSKFRPLSYGEMVAPLQAYSNFVNQCLAKLEKLMENAEQIEPYINKAIETKTWERYASYYNSISAEYNRIIDRGTDQGTRRRINELARTFSDVIDNIGNAYNRRAELSRNQFQRIQSTHERCSRYFADIPLDEFLDGKTPIVNYY